MATRRSAGLPLHLEHLPERLGLLVILVLEVILIAAPFVLPIAAAIYLAVRLRGHANATPATG